MPDGVIIALITFCSAIGGGLITGYYSNRAAKFSADREDKRRREELERESARQRLNELYDSLLTRISPAKRISFIKNRV